MFLKLFSRVFPKSFKIRSQARAGKRLMDPIFAFSLALFAAVIVSCVFAPAFATHDPYANDLPSSLALPSSEHLLGCDKNGRDIFSRTLYGGRTALLGSVGVVGLSILIGIPLGLTCGYFGGIADTVAMRICDIILAFPTLLLAFIFVAAFGRGLGVSVVALGVVYVPMLTRLTRSLALVERQKTYITACRCLGYSPARIMFAHILPNCVSTVAVQLTLDLGYAILDLSALSFLGLAVSEPTADWGAMLGQGRMFLLENPFLALGPAAFIVALVVSINLIGDSLHQYFDETKSTLPTFAAYEKRKRRLDAIARSPQTQKKGGEA